MSRSLSLAPCSLADAKITTAAWHRRLPEAGLGHLWSTAAVLDGRVVGVIIVGRPVVRMLDNGRTVEVTRCTTDGTPNACSLLYSATWRAAKARGYLAATTMTDADEPGASLRGAGWAVIAEVAANAGWDRSHINGRKRANTHNPARLRWAAPGSDFTSPPEPIYPTPPLIDADSLPLELA